MSIEPRLRLPEAFSTLSPLGKLLANYSPQDLWEQDTRSLPRALARHRRRSRRIAARLLAPRAAELDNDPRSEATRAILVQGAGQGLLSDVSPTPLGSARWGQLRYPFQWAQCIKLEELCAVCGGLGNAFGAHVLGLAPVLLSGRLRDIWRWARVYRANQRGSGYVMAFALSEPEGGSDLQHTPGATHYRPCTRARRVAGGWCINGVKRYITGADVADGLTVFAALDDGDMTTWTCFFVPRHTPGVQVVRRLPKMGQHASAASELRLNDVVVPERNVIGGLGRGWALSQAVFNYSRLPVGAIALGIARGAAEQAIEFAQRARQGGRALAHWQDAQLAIAQMLIDLSAMRAVVWEAARRWVPRRSAGAMCKVFCSDTAMKVCQSAMDLVGETAVHQGVVEKGYRDARLTQIYEGTNAINRLAAIEDLFSDWPVQ